MSPTTCTPRSMVSFGRRMLNPCLVLKTTGRGYFLLLSLICLTRTTLAVCYKTPTDAIAEDVTNTFYPISENDGYRLAKIKSDLVLKQTWAMVIPCGHPGWPAVAVPLQTTTLPVRLREQESAKESPGSLVVRAGDTVELWRQERSLRIEVAGISEGNARLGDLVKVRLLRVNADEQPLATPLYGIVRGPASVEMKP